MLGRKCINSPSKQRKKTSLAQHISAYYTWNILGGGIFGFVQQIQIYGFNAKVTKKLYCSNMFSSSHTVLFLALTTPYHATSDCKATHKAQR